MIANKHKILKQALSHCSLKPRMCVRALSHVIYERQRVGIFLSLSSQVFLSKSLLAAYQLMIKLLNMHINGHRLKQFVSITCFW